MAIGSEGTHNIIIYFKRHYCKFNKEKGTSWLSSSKASVVPMQGMQFDPWSGN